MAFPRGNRASFQWKLKAKVELKCLKIFLFATNNNAFVFT